MKKQYTEPRTTVVVLALSSRYSRLAVTMSSSILMTTRSALKAAAAGTGAREASLASRKTGRIITFIF